MPNSKKATRINSEIKRAKKIVENLELAMDSYIMALGGNVSGENTNNDKVAKMNDAHSKHRRQSAVSSVPRTLVK